MDTRRFTNDLKQQIQEKSLVRKNLVLKNNKLIQEIKDNVKRRRELTREIRELQKQLRIIKSNRKNVFNRSDKIIPRKVDRIDLSSGSDVEVP